MSPISRLVATLKFGLAFSGLYFPSKADISEGRVGRAPVAEVEEGGFGGCAPLGEVGGFDGG